MDQLFGWVAAGSATSALAAFVLIVWRTRGLRRRLFLTLLVVGVVPAATVGGVTWRETSGLGRLADSPGLRQAVDASIGLARDLLDAYALDLADRTAQWARSGAASLEDPRFGWIRRGPGPPVTAGSVDPALVATLAPTRGAGRLEDPPLLYCTIELAEGGYLTGVRHLDAELAARLQAAGRGAAGLRQLGLYYEQILRGRALLVMAAVFLFSVLLAFLVSAGLTDRLVRPLADLVLATRRVADGEREFVVDTRAVDEVLDLQIAFNDMTTQLMEGEAQLRRTERLAAWQGIARRLAHEIKNPLTPIRLAVHRARQRVEDPVVIESLAAIEEETVNLHHLATEFSALGRLPAPRRGPVGAAGVAREVGVLYLPPEFTLLVEGDALLDADEGQLRQVYSNLFKNAVEAGGLSGKILLMIRPGPARAQLLVEDDGPGLGDDPELLFEPEYTTRSSGTGLGLAIVRRIVEDHGGVISAAAAASGGASFVIEWPLAEEADA